MVIRLEPTTPGQAPRSVYIGDSRKGTIWRNIEYKKILSGHSKKGTLLKIYDTTQPRNNYVDRPIALGCVCFSKEVAGVPLVNNVSYSYSLALTDERGHIYGFDFVKNEFWLVARTGISATAMQFNQVRRREIIVALGDGTIHCYNIDTCQLVAKLPSYHRQPPHLISVHPTRPLCISCAQSEAILWDTDKWERIRILSGSDEGVQQVSFSPDGVSIVGAFQDGSIYFWTIDSFSLLWKISLSQLAGPNTEQMQDMTKFLVFPRISHFDISSNGEFFVYCGLSSTIYVWNLFEKRLLHEILIPSFKNRMITQVVFIEPSVVGLVSESGELIVLNIEDAKFLGQLRIKHQFKQFAISPDGGLMATLFQDTKYIATLFRIDTFLHQDVPTPEPVELIEEEKPKPARVQLVAEPPQTFYQLIESKSSASAFNRSRLRGFLNYYGTFPEQYRQMIWRYLLNLPENRTAYESLLDQGTHPTYKDFRKSFPLKSDRLARAMEKMLSCLAFWSPIFENLDYLPSVVFPFVKLYVGDLFSCLEVLMTVLINWCQKWWEYYPNPPVECLDIIEHLLGFHDPELLRHFVDNKITSATYAWLMLQTLFSEQFSKQDWLTLWDHLVVNQPSFLYHILVAYLIRFRKPLLETTRLSDFEYFFQRRNPTNVNQVILLAYKLSDATPSSLSPSSFVSGFMPLLHGDYPVFNKYPEFIVNYQSKMKEKIRKEEEEYIRKRKTAEELTRLTEELQRDKSAWDQADWKMNEMVEQWWDQMLGQEKSRQQRRAEMDLAEKDKRAAAINTIAQVRRSFVDNQQNATAKHISDIAKAVGENEKTHWRELNQRDFDDQFQKLEEEWKERREQLILARKDLSEIQKNRMERCKI
ncbi:WD40-repeat-containing domain protein [Gorgonomyces haynaldii]|nr:WD40-repeat-containing domain protein [Gorgonomyces haynaldii]